MQLYVYQCIMVQLFNVYQYIQLLVSCTVIIVHRSSKLFSIFNAGPITAQSAEISLPISLGVFIPIIAILIALLALFILLYISAVHRKKETIAQVTHLQSRVTELSTVYEELDPRASRLIIHNNSNNSMETMDNNAYNVPRKTTPPKSVDPEVPLGEAYEIMRSVKHQ